nr:TPA_asm: m147 iORF RNA 1 [Murid betaherpesvirus 1]DBA08118.1 TPA_asm: m147 iORF RNA 1 [Murid betaherpesvirus 1]
MDSAHLHPHLLCDRLSAGVSDRAGARTLDATRAASEGDRRGTTGARSRGLRYRRVDRACIFPPWDS